MYQTNRKLQTKLRKLRPQQFVKQHGFINTLHIARLLFYRTVKGASMQVGQSIQDTTAAHRKYHCIQVEKQGLRLVKKAKKVFYEFLSTRSWMPKHICASIPLLGGIVQYLVLRPISWVHQGLLLSESLLQSQLLLRSHTRH